jgi:hypothetical protein
MDQQNTGREKIKCTTLIQNQCVIINYLLYGTNNKILYVNTIYFLRVHLIPSSTGMCSVTKMEGLG